MGDIGDPDQPVEGVLHEVNRHQQEVVLGRKQQRRRAGHPARGSTVEQRGDRKREQAAPCGPAARAGGSTVQIDEHSSPPVESLRFLAEPESCEGAPGGWEVAGQNQKVVILERSGSRVAVNRFQRMQAAHDDHRHTGASQRLKYLGEGQPLRERRGRLALSAAPEGGFQPRMHPLRRQCVEHPVRQAVNPVIGDLLEKRSDRLGVQGGQRREQRATSGTGSRQHADQIGRRPEIPDRCGLRLDRCRAGQRYPPPGLSCRLRQYMFLNNCGKHATCARGRRYVIEISRSRRAERGASKG